MNVLGIETSCDETALAVVADGTHILSNVVSSQVELHARYGGVVPELASREHVRAIVPVLDEGLRETVDDAAGEAFDKVARLLGLGFPGGPAIESLASEAAAPAGRLPRARLERPYDFSFSGLKAKVQRIVRGEEGAAPPPAALAAAFQESVVDSLVTKAVQAATDHDAREIILAGGVAANSALRTVLAERSPVPVIVPPPALCTDNGAMIAAAGYQRLLAGETAGLEVDIDPGLRIG